MSLQKVDSVCSASDKITTASSLSLAVTYNNILPGYRGHMIRFFRIYFFGRIASIWSRRPALLGLLYGHELFDMILE